VRRSFTCSATSSIYYNWAIFSTGALGVRTLTGATCLSLAAPGAGARYCGLDAARTARAYRLALLEWRARDYEPVTKFVERLAPQPTWWWQTFSRIYGVEAEPQSVFFLTSCARFQRKTGDCRRGHRATGTSRGT